MPAAESAAHLSWRGAAAMMLLLLGALLVVLSIAWPRVATGRGSWPEAKAEAYQSAASRLHQLSMQAAATPPEKQSRELHTKLADAEAEYAHLRAELDTVRERPARIATLLRYAGLALLAGGTVALLVWR